MQHNTDQALTLEQKIALLSGQVEHFDGRSYENIPFLPVSVVITPNLQVGGIEASVILASKHYAVKQGLLAAVLEEGEELAHIAESVEGAVDGLIANLKTRQSGEPYEIDESFGALVEDVAMLRRDEDFEAGCEDEDGNLMVPQVAKLKLINQNLVILARNLVAAKNACQVLKQEGLDDEARFIEDEACQLVEDFDTLVKCRTRLEDQISPAA